MDALRLAALTTLRQALTILGPVAFLALLLHALEKLLSARLVTRLGWRGVLVTGWLGVPVHELSHVVACWIFGHRVERVQLFAPDRTTGRLGSVQHAWQRRNPYQQVGRFFIGIAPLLGGAAALWGLTAWLAPVDLAFPRLAPGADLFQVMGVIGDQVGALFGALTQPGALASGRTWLWLYLCLCVGAHLAPSGSDLKGGLPGFVLLVVLVFLTNLVVTWTRGDPAAGEQFALSVSAPAMALFSLALALGAGGLAVVTLVTAPLPERGG